MDEASSLGTSVTGWRDPAPYRCGHCHQVSNWKHVIQVFLTNTNIHEKKKWNGLLFAGIFDFNRCNRISLLLPVKISFKIIKTKRFSTTANRYHSILTWYPTKKAFGKFITQVIFISFGILCGF